MIVHLNPSEVAAVARALNSRISVLQTRVRDGDARPNDEADVVLLDPIRRQVARAAEPVTVPR